MHKISSNIIGLLLATIAAILMLTSCGGHEENSHLLSSSHQSQLIQQTTTFEKFCKLASLDCKDVVTPIPSKRAWEDGLTTFKTLVDSPSVITLTREQMERGSVRDLITLTGSSEIIDFINSIPWETLKISSNTIELRSSMPEFIVSNGITFRSGYYTKINIDSKYSMSVSGLSLITRRLGQEKVELIDLSSPGKVSIGTERRQIKEIPLSYLIPNEFPTKTKSDAHFSSKSMMVNPNFSVDKLIRTIADVMLEKGYEWYKLIDIKFLDTHIGTFTDLLANDISKNPFADAIFLALESTESITIGGKRQSPLEINFTKGLKCKMFFKNVPVLGNIVTKLGFESSVGLTDAVKTTKDGREIVKASIAGISTRIGNIHKLILDGDNISLRVGAFTIPVYEGQPVRDGIQLEKLECKK